MFNLTIVTHQCWFTVKTLILGRKWGFLIIYWTDLAGRSLQITLNGFLLFFHLKLSGFLVYCNFFYLLHITIIENIYLRTLRTLYCLLPCLQKVLKWCVKRGILTPNPFLIFVILMRLAVHLAQNWWPHSWLITKVLFFKQNGQLLIGNLLI